jgi:hypothetical protein
MGLNELAFILPLRRNAAIGRDTRLNQKSPFIGRSAKYGLRQRRVPAQHVSIC